MGAARNSRSVQALAGISSASRCISAGNGAVIFGHDVVAWWINEGSLLDAGHFLLLARVISVAPAKPPTLHETGAQGPLGLNGK